MKKSILLVASLMLFLGSGCDSFLDETNYSDVTSEGGYYDTEEGLNAIVNACYTPLRFWAGKEDAIGLSETGTDIIASLAPRERNILQCEFGVLFRQSLYFKQSHTILLNFFSIKHQIPPRF